MKKIILFLLCFSQAAHAASLQPIEFSARISKEELAEEAIDLLHCISDRLELPWELNEGGKGLRRLRLVEKDGKLEGSFVRPEGEKKLSFGVGEAGNTCEEILPEEKESTPAPSLAPSPETEPANFSEALEPRAPKNWVWLGATAAVVLGGFLFWKSRQPDHRAITME